MLLWNTRLKYVTLCLFCAAMASCSGVQYSQRPSWVEVKISDFDSVAGNWEGSTWMEPKTVRESDWATVTINHDGTFKFATYRNIGAWEGTGILHLEDGRLVSPRADQEGTIQMTLFKSDEKRMLRVDATDKRGLLQRAELTPAKKKDKADKS